jgi:hypothetical protein
VPTARSFSDTREFHARTVYTTGDIGKLFCLAPRTVAKLIDKGVIPGWKIPSSQDRRVNHSQLVTWLRERPEYVSILTRLQVAEKVARALVAAE